MLPKPAYKTIIVEEALGFGRKFDLRKQVPF